MTTFTRLIAATSLTVLAVALAACGGETADSQGGGEITIGLTAEPDSLDPAVSFSPEVWESLWLVYTPLLTYEHAEGSEGSRLIPGLAEELPEVSDDGKRYELRLRRGLEYADGTPVRAGDFEHAIKRVLLLDSPGTPFFTRIVGVDEFLDEGRAGADIEGIQSDDDSGRITIELSAPDDTFSNSLASTFAALVPSDTPPRERRSRPPAGVGPFTFAEPEGDAEFALERTPGFSVPGIPRAELERISVEVTRNAGRATQDVIIGDLDYFVNPPSPDQLAEVRERYADRFSEFTTNSTYYFFMRPDLPPFDEPRVREAVNLATDQGAIARLFGGLMTPTCNVLPPNVPGYEALEPCPYGDPEGQPDTERARELVESAGSACTEVTVWGSSEPEPRRTTEYMADVLNQIGLDAEPRIIGPATYFPTVGAERTEAQIGFANFFLDFPHPANLMQIVDGDIVEPRATPNLGRVEDDEITSRIDELRKQDLSAAAAEWAELDRQVVEDAWIVPFGHRELTTFVSERMNPECAQVHPVYGHDYTAFCLDG